MSALVWLGFGLILGSFTNVLILRQGMGALRGRSACPSCKCTLRVRDLVPVFSWIFLRARCHACAAPISVQYPLVEVIVGLGCYVIGGLVIPLHIKLIACAIVVVIVAIAVYDLYHMLMPNSWVWTWNVLALAFTALWLFEVGAPVHEYIVVLAWGMAVGAPLFALHFFSHGAWMGFGDVKFALGMGFLLGPYGFLALFYAFVSGALIGLLLIFVSSPYGGRIRAFVTPTRSAQSLTAKVTMKSEVPFGPFLIFGTAIVWVALLYGYIPLLSAFGALPL